MTRPGKIALGAVTVYPILYMFAFFAFVFGMMFVLPGRQSGPFGGGGGARPDIFGYFAVLMVFHFLTILTMFGLLAFYVAHVIRNEAIKNEMKILWAVVVLMAGPLGMCVYWYMNIWKETPLSPPSPAPDRPRKHPDLERPPSSI
jgi:hypothetical protein